MQKFQIDESILASLATEEKELVKKLVSIVKEDTSRLENLCEFVKKKTNEKDLAHFTDLSDEVKFSACVGHLVVNILSGKIQKKDLSELVR